MINLFESFSSLFEDKFDLDDEVPVKDEEDVVFDDDDEFLNKAMQDLDLEQEDEEEVSENDIDFPEDASEGEDKISDILDNIDDKESNDYVDAVNDKFEQAVPQEEALEEAKVPHKRGSIEYEANEGRLNRVNLYRKLAGMTEDEPIEESGIKEWALKRTSAISCCDVDRLKSELLGEQWSIDV